MIARLILAVALLLAALPASVATPACHEAAAPATAHAAMGMAQHDTPPTPAPADHGEAMCVGCIAPATLHRARVAPPMLVAALPGSMPGRIDRANPDSTPEPPPPRA